MEEFARASKSSEMEHTRNSSILQRMKEFARENEAKWEKLMGECEESGEKEFDHQSFSRQKTIVKPYENKVVIPDEEHILKMKQCKTKEKERTKILRNNIDLLIAKNSQKMSKLQQKWIDSYNEWYSNLKSSDEAWLENFPGGSPPIKQSGDPVARARIKFMDDEHFDPDVARVAEMAIQFYNKKHEGSDFEVVEIRSFCHFLYFHEWIHINFTAKPKNASVADDVRSFFAEHFSDDFSSYDHGHRDKITEGVITTCCLMEEGSTTNVNCGYCSRASDVLHPINDGFVFNRDVTFKIQDLVDVTHKEQFQKLGVHPPKGVLLYVHPRTRKSISRSSSLKLAGPHLIQDLVEETHKKRFQNLGVHPIKGVLLNRPPGTRKWKSIYSRSSSLKLAGPYPVSAFKIDAIGTKSVDSQSSGDIERIVLEIVNQFDPPSIDDPMKVTAATNSADILDPALMRSGRLDRKIEFLHPTEEARARILQIHSRKMNVHPDVNFEELARSTDDLNWAQLFVS